MPNFNDSDELQKQYGTAKNLNTRASLHAMFSTNKLGWSSWVFQQYGLRPGLSVLELGCGSADMWAGRAEALRGVKLLLSDFSEGMLEAARESTHDLPGVSYEQIDAQDIPHFDGSFDMVIANHMLYHVPDIDKALGEIARVLRPGGMFYATTLGVGNMKELHDMLHRFHPESERLRGSFTAAFRLENGAPQLCRHFAHVELRRYPDSLHVTQAQPLIDYALSMAGMEDAGEFARHIEGIIARDGAIDITKDAGMFIAR